MQAKRKKIGIKQLWLPLVVAASGLVAVIAICTIDRVSLAEPAELTVTPVAPPVSLGEPVVSYRIAGTGVAHISYLAATGDLVTTQQQLPWSITIKMSSPLRPASINAVVSNPTSLSCAVSVDKVQRITRTRSDTAVISCEVMSI